MCWQAPTVVSATAVAASSRERRIATVASPVPSSRSPSIRTPPRWIRACLVVGSTGSSGSASRSVPGTTARRNSSPTRRAIATSSAVSPSTTKSLVPVRTQPPPSAVAVASTSAGSQVPDPSSTASVPVRSPLATGPRNRNRSSAEPTSRIAGANCVVVARNGPGAAAWPDASRTIACSTQVMPRPPTSGSSARAGQSSEVSVAQRSAGS